MRPPKKPPASAKAYVAYYRVSTDRQGESGLGLDAQRAAVARVASNASILAEYTEIESGKRSTNRPQLLAALADAKKRNAILIIAKLDRLARNVHFISGLMESSVDFVAADMPSANRLTIHILAAVAEHEREMISQRTKAALEQVKAHLKEKGFWISKQSGRRITKLGGPNWRESIAKARKARHPQTNVVVLPIEVMREYRKDGVSLREIAGKLNQQGVKTPFGHVWYASTVSKALKAA